MKTLLVGRVQDPATDSSLETKKTVCIHIIAVSLALGRYAGGRYCWLIFFAILLYYLFCLSLSIVLFCFFTSAKEVNKCFCRFLFVYLSVCLWVIKITRKVMDGSFWNFEGMSGMAQTTSDSILGWSGRNPLFWITEIFVSMGLKGKRCCCYGAGTWRTTWRWIKVF